MKKTNLVLIFMLIMLLAMSTGLMAQTTATAPDGSGTDIAPYLISNLAELSYVCQNLGDTDYWASGVYLKQDSDIDATETQYWDDAGSGDLYDDAEDGTSGGNNEGFSPIGNSSDEFLGTYNGDGHTIDGLTINRGATNDIGLFGFTLGSTIENLGVTNVSIIGKNNSGGLAGYVGNSSTISNCYSTGTVSATLTGMGTGSIGGLLGRNGINSESSIINDCYSTVTVTGYNDASYIGGLIGTNVNGVMNRCYATGNVSGEKYTIGGLVGTNGGTSTINNCYSKGNVSGTASPVGGLVGYNDAAINKSYSVGTVAGSSVIGGLVGTNGIGCTVSNSFYNSTISGQSDTGKGTPKTTDQMTTDALVYNYATNIYLNVGWDFKGESTNGTDEIWNIGNSRNNGYPYLDWEYPSDPGTLPVELSTFTAQFIENTPTLYWETQSETDNMGWFVYRGEENDFTTSKKISDFIEGHGTTTQQQSYIYEDRIQNPEVGSTFYYWLESIDYSGMVNHYDKVAVLTIPDNDDPGNGPNAEPVLYGLFQNEPNPFISSTKISFNLHETAKVDLNVYNLKGQLVKTLYSGVTSKYTIMWNGKDINGRELSPGVYLYKLLINGKTAETKKLILMQ